MIDQNKIVFICGLHRSGTSLLYKLLKRHSQTSGFENTGVPEDEGQHLQSVFKPAKDFGGPGRFGFNQRSFLDETSPLFSAENGQKLWAEWSQYWDLASPVLLEKSPPNLVRTRFLQGLFPSSYFIVLLRHPIAVSYATQKWSRAPVGSLIKHWLVCHERFTHDAPFLNRVITIKYEDLVSQPTETLGSLFDFLGIQNERIDLDIRSGINHKYFKRWQEAPGGKWREYYLKRVKAKYEDRVEKFGYSLENLELNK